MAWGLITASWPCGESAKALQGETQKVPIQMQKNAAMDFCCQKRRSLSLFLVPLPQQ